MIPMQIAGHNGGPITFTVITGVERADDVPTIEHEAPVATIEHESVEAKPEPTPPPVQEPAQAAERPRAHTCRRHAPQRLQNRRSGRLSRSGPSAGPWARHGPDLRPARR